MRRRLQAFLRHDTGAARTEAAFAVTALLVVVGMAAYLLTSGPPQDSGPARLAPEEAALEELMGGEIRQFSRFEVSQRLDTYFDPYERTEAQLRNAHATWAARDADPLYRDPDLANDMRAIIERAMDARGVTPRRGL